MNKELIQIPVQNTGTRMLSDGGLGLTYRTNEIAKEDMQIFMDNHFKFGYLVFKPDSKLNDKDIPKGDSNFENKTPSQRLFGKMFRYFILKNGEENKDKFREWYEKQINGLINQYDNKIKELFN